MRVYAVWAQWSGWAQRVRLLGICVTRERAEQLIKEETVAKFWRELIMAWIDEVEVLK